MTRDVLLLFGARSVRLFGYGGLVVVLVLYLARVGLSAAEIGILLSLTLVGDTVVSLFLTTRADAIGRRRVLVFGGVLMAASGAVFAGSDVFIVLLVAATLGVISTTGHEVGPFLAIEQASLSHVVHDRRRTGIFAWYNVVGSIATALGSLVAGLAVGAMRSSGWDDLDAYRVVLFAYAVVGLALAGIFRLVSPAVELAPDEERPQGRLGLHRSKGIVARLSVLFMVDSFASGLIPMTLVTYWLHLRFGVDEAYLGGVFFFSNILNAGSALASARIAARFGLINTMVFSHLPANVLLALIPFSPSLEIAVAIIYVRSAVAQMDVPARQSYTMAVVDPDERSAAAGITSIARTTGQALAPGLSTPLLVIPGLAMIPFIAGGALKIVYDISLWAMFRLHPAPHERGGSAHPDSLDPVESSEPT